MGAFLNFLKEVFNLIIKENPELTVYLLAIVFMMFMMSIMYLIVKKILDSKK